MRDTQILEITATDESATEAAAISQACADAYLAHRRNDALQRVLAATTGFEQRVEGIRERLTSVVQGKGESATANLAGRRRASGHAADPV